MPLYAAKPVRNGRLTKKLLPKINVRFSGLTLGALNRRSNTPPVTLRDGNRQDRTPRARTRRQALRGAAILLSQNWGKLVEAKKEGNPSSSRKHLQAATTAVSATK